MDKEMEEEFYTMPMAQLPTTDNGKMVFHMVWASQQSKTDK